MQGELQKIQDVVQGIAEAIASALMLEVEIMDENFVVVGATGRIRSQIGIKQDTAHVARHVISCGTNLTIDQPGKHPLCEVCKLTDKCFYSAALLCPINLNGRVLGTISLVSFDEEQKKQLLRRQAQYHDFIARMGELLAGQVQLNEALNLITASEKHLKTIIDSVSEGVIAVDSFANITYFNKAAEHLLNQRASLLIGKPVKNYFPDSPLTDVLKLRTAIEEKDVAYRTQNKQVKLLCSAYPIIVGTQVVGAVESFKEIDKLSRVATRLAGNHESITFNDILGSSPALQNLIYKAKMVGAGNSTILLRGESGTGKELFARAIHNASPFKGGPFQAINCSAIPDSLLESELFGYEEGAFTGARKGGKPGKFELADGGTLLLDEIGDLPLLLQSKLLRVLESSKLERVGGTKELSFNVRIIAATNRDLERMIEQKQFREDLFYRLNVIPLHIPSLPERQEDIILLAEHFLEKYNVLLGKHIAGLDEDVKQILLDHTWPGNIRELENIIEYAVNFEQTARIRANSLPQALKRNIKPVNGKQQLKKQLKEQEREIILNMLEETGSSLQAKKAIASNLGISLTTLYRKLNK